MCETSKFSYLNVKGDKTRPEKCHLLGRCFFESVVDFQCQNSLSFTDSELSETVLARYDVSDFQVWSMAKKLDVNTRKL